MPLCVSFGEQMLSFLSGKYIAVQWLSQCVDLCLASGDTAKQFYKVVVSAKYQSFNSSHPHECSILSTIGILVDVS